MKIILYIVINDKVHLALILAAPSRPPRRRHFKTPVVIDNGSEILKVGLADGAFPAVSMPTIVGRLKKDIESFRHRSDVFFGNQVARKYGLVCVDYPMVGEWCHMKIVSRGLVAWKVMLEIKHKIQA